VFPNPSAGSVSIVCDSDAEFSVVDLYGRAWVSGLAPAINMKLDLPDGVYFLVSARTDPKKLIIQGAP
jgi:hypothetical protein